MRCVRLPVSLVSLVLVFAGYTRDNSAVNGSPLENTLLLGDTLRIAYEETLVNFDERVSISFDSLLEDSRCPIGAACKWEGNAAVSLILAKDDSNETFVLKTYPDFMNDTTLFDYDVTLVDVFPYPHIDSSYTADDYWIRVLVDR